MSPYRFQLLRYMPNRLSEEFFNVAVLLYDAAGRLLDARFAPDFLRLRCNPLADLELLRSLKQEFEDRRLAGEGFSQYVEEISRDLSQGLQISEPRAFFGGEALEEVERLSSTYLATPHRVEVHEAAVVPGTRRWILGRMREVFRLHHLEELLQSDVAVGDYVSPRFSFSLDYAYKPNGVTHYLHALSLHRDITEASRLCFVFDRMRTRSESSLTAVVADELPDDTRALLDSSAIRPWAVSRLDELAVAVRRDLGLQ